MWQILAPFLMGWLTLKACSCPLLILLLNHRQNLTPNTSSEIAELSINCLTDSGPAEVNTQSYLATVNLKTATFLRNGSKGRRQIQMLSEAIKQELSWAKTVNPNQRLLNFSRRWSRLSANPGGGSRATAQILEDRGTSRRWTVSLFHLLAPKTKPSLPLSVVECVRFTGKEIISQWEFLRSYILVKTVDLIISYFLIFWQRLEFNAGFLGGSDDKASACSEGWEDALEKKMATPSSTLAWKIPWTEKPGRLQSMGSHRVEHGWVTSLSLWV